MGHLTAPCVMNVSGGSWDITQADCRLHAFYRNVCPATVTKAEVRRRAGTFFEWKTRPGASSGRSGMNWKKGSTPGGLGEGVEGGEDAGISLMKVGLCLPPLPHLPHPGMVHKIGLSYRIGGRGWGWGRPEKVGCSSLASVLDRTTGSVPAPARPLTQGSIQPAGCTAYSVTLPRTRPL